jgi:alkylation response protein AidB-like acyl-CoA dehydrogenase
MNEQGLPMAEGSMLAQTSLQPAQDERRRRLLAAVDAIAPRLEAANLEGEALRGPTPDAVAALHEAGLMGLKAPLELGGDEADWTLQTEVFEKIAYHNFSVAWCMMLYADNTGRALASLSDAGLKRIMADGRIPAICGGGGMLYGDLVPAPGGYRVTGRWIYGSGIPEADYVMVGARLPSQGDEPGEVRQVIMPVRDITIEDTWNVMGLRGSGSCDFNAKDVFVPEELVLNPRVQLRGGALFRLSVFGYTGLCMPAVMIGSARRALDEIARTAAAKSRGYVAKTTLAHRGVFQKFLGEADLKLKAARQLSIATGEKLLHAVETEGESPIANEVEARAVGAHCANVAIEVVNGIVSYGGGSGVKSGALFERTLRDMHMAGTHVFVSDVAFENHGQFLMELPDATLLA